MDYKSNESFNLLSKLLTENKGQLTAEQLELRQKYDELFVYITKNLADNLDASVYEQKTNLMLQLEQLLMRIEFFVQFPKAVNKSIVTVVGPAKEAVNFFNQFLSEEDTKRIRMNTNIPAIIYQDEHKNKIQSLNTLGNVEFLDFKEYEVVNKELYKKGIDIRWLLQLYYVPVANSSENIIFLYLPSFSLKEQNMHTLLGHLGENVVILVDERDRWKSEMQSLLRGSIVNKIHLLSPDLYLEEAKKISQEENSIVVHSINGDIKSMFQKFDLASYNTAFEELLFEKLMVYCISIEEILKKQNKLIKNISEDILKTSDEEMTQLFYTLRLKIKDENKEITENHTKLLRDIKIVVELAQELDRLIEAQSSVMLPSITKTTPFIIKNMIALVLVLIDNNDLTSARNYMGKLKQFRFDHMRALEIYMNLKKTHVLDEIDITYLSNIGLNIEISRIQLKVWPQLSMDAKALKGLENLYGKSYDAAVLYELGLAYESVNELKTAQEYYWRSVNLGGVEAAERLISFVDKNDIRDMEKLGELLIPEANYHVGKYYLHKEKTYKKAITALKLAAAYEHLGAIKELSQIEFNSYAKIRKKDSDKAEGMWESLISLHQYLIENDENTNDVLERLGKLFYWNEYYKKALPLLEKSNTADAQFLCGKIYQYGNGYAQDLIKAKKFFEAAKMLGHKQAENEYLKVEGWIQSNKSKEQYSASRNYVATSTTTYTSSSSSSSKKGCFLTTATCVALNKPDNCKEILAFKTYRDNSLVKDLDGKKFIVEYYRIAPLLVEAIDAMPNSKEKYLYLYNKYINTGYGYLQNQDMVRAKQTYIDMVKELCRDYNIQPFSKED